MVDVLVKVAPKVYGPYVSTDKQGRKQLLVNASTPSTGRWLRAYCTTASSPIGDGDADYEENPMEQATDLPGELIPEVAPDHVEITGVDMEYAEPIESQTDDSMNPIEIPGVDSAHQMIEINDLDVSPPSETALLEPTRSNEPRRSDKSVRLLKSMSQACLARVMPAHN